MGIMQRPSRLQASEVVYRIVPPRQYQKKPLFRMRYLGDIYLNVHPVLATIVKRLGLGLMTLFVVSVIIFSSISMLPGDFGEAVLGQTATEETKQAFRRELGLDQPAYIRYVQWLGDVVQGDLGTSFSGRSSSGVDRSRKVADLVGPRLGNTLFLAGITALIAVPLALLLGITAALYRNSLYDRVINAVTLGTIATPEFFVAYVLILFFASLWPIFPSLATVDAATPFLERLDRIALPVITLTLVIVAHMMRMTRAAILNLMASPYIEMARLKGTPPLQVILRHALPNAWAPIATVIAFNLAYLVVGVVVVEVVFVYPGIGQLMVDAVTTRDIPVVQACALIFAATYIILNIVADVVGIITNPRLLHPR
jgi:peptide/nickel transport system permease protein